MQGDSHLDIARWLFEMKPTIDLSLDNDDDILNSICLNFHISIAKWLFHMKPTFYYTKRNITKLLNVDHPILNRKFYFYYYAIIHSSKLSDHTIQYISLFI